MQRLHTGYNDANYAMVDPTGVLGWQIEVQSDVSEEKLYKMSQDLGFEQLQRHDNPKDGKPLAYIFPLKGTTGYAYTVQEQLMRTNKVQHYLMKIISWLHNNEFLEPVSQIFDDNILLRYNPTRFPGAFMITDIGYAFNYGVCIDIQGEISQEDVQNIASAVELPLPELMIHKDEFIGYRIRTGIKYSYYTHMSVYVQKDQRILALWVKIVNYLKSVGWIYMFAYTKGLVPGYVHYKRI